MGAHPYQYVVEYQENAQAALERLRQEVFARGEYSGVQKKPRTPEEALELSGESGTRSILDITRIRDRPDFGCAAPLTPAELERYFGTATPTVAMVEECDQLWQDLERGKARYIVTYEGDARRNIMFVGYSFDSGPRLRPTGRRGAVDEYPMTQSFADAVFEPLPGYREYPVPEMEARSRGFAAEMQRRRTTRQFSDRPVPRSVIEACLEAAGTAPSGAHLQPWHFVVVTDPALKRRIRVAAERAEEEFYATAPAEWLAALAPLGTDARKPYLETAPYLIAVFAERYGLTATGERRARYYVNESVGIATGFLLAALHHAGLVALTHTPNPMGFLSELLERPVNERPVMLVVTGYPASDAQVPCLRRKPLKEIVTFR